jgi:hypothetical protein
MFAPSAFRLQFEHVERSREVLWQFDLERKRVLARFTGLIWEIRNIKVSFENFIFMLLFFKIWMF